MSIFNREMKDGTVIGAPSSSSGAGGGGSSSSNNTTNLGEAHQLPNPELALRIPADGSAASSTDESTDLAILKIVDENFRGFDETPNYNFETEPADVGNRVYAYGYPMALSIMGKELKITDGLINANTGYKGDVKTYQISAPIQGGNSGGPLFNEDGDFVGVNSSGLTKEVADNVGYSIKSNYVLNLINALPEKIELPYSYTISWLSTEKQIKRLSQYVVLIKVQR